MPSGLVALLDDVASITKLAAASIDDIGAAAGRAGTKAAGVVVDDAAVTPRYVTGFTPDRELPIIYRIAKGSLKNKLLFLLPAAIALSAIAPWAITPLLMLGGAYLCYEATEKIMEKVIGHDAHVADVPVGTSPFEMEQEKVSGAIRTDFILSAEIMAIALADVADSPLISQAVILAVVGIAITVAVYGTVGLIVKMDDIGLHLAQRRAAVSRMLGRGLVLGMPKLMVVLGIVGTAAMLWVGGGIIVHGLEEFHFDAVPHALHGIAEAAAHALPFAHGAAAWLVNAALAAVAGLVIGGFVIAALKLINRVRGVRAAH
ncbi:MAG TPA: DUF808 domain-containing protein [Allosphingosinicella sp.]|nr:DUF808 domain-containing protein [Allosphingosinicella sp.]